MRVNEGRRRRSGLWVHVLDQLLGLDVGHTVHTGDTITARRAVSHKI